MLKKVNQCGAILGLVLCSSMSFAQVVDEECRETDKISCVDLAIGISAIDSSLDNQNPPVSFTDLGNLLSTVKASPTLFATLNGGLTAAVGISFDNIDDFFGAVIKCDLVAHVIDEIND